MKLHEAIEKILIDAKKPLNINEIANQINLNDLYIRKDERIINRSQVSARVRQYKHLFQIINNQVFLISDNKWKDILSTYWYIADFLRGLLSISEFQFLIASIFYYKRFRDLKDKNEIYSLRARDIKLYSLSNRHNFEFDKSKRLHNITIYNEYLNILNKLDKNIEFDLNKIIYNLNTNEYSESEFGNIFEYILHLDSLDSSKSPIIYTPKNLQELMINLLDPQDSKSIYDPLCGTGGILVEALHYSNGNLRTKGTEINNRIALLSLMNLEMHGFFDTEIYNVNCFDELSNNETYDYIVGDLPFDGIANTFNYYNLFSKWNISSPSSGKGFSGLILFILSKLKKTGKAVFIVSESFLYKKGKEKEIREILISLDIIETIIGLPDGALRPNSEGKVALILLNQNKTLKNKIKFIKAKSISGDKQGIDIDIDDILSLNNENLSENENMHIVSINDLLNDVNLSVYAYDTGYSLTKQMLKEGSGKYLGDLMEIKSGISIEKRDSEIDVDIPYIKIENLFKDILNIYLTKEKIFTKVSYDSKYQRSYISEECILVARIGENLKPTYFKPTENFSSILVHNGVYILIPKNKNIDLEYLYYQLNSTFIVEQIARLKKGSIMPSISMKSLKQLLIPYVDLKAQKDFVRSQKVNIIASERAKIEEKIKALGYKEEKVQVESDIVRTLVHQLRPTLLNINLEVENIKRIVNQNNLSDFKESIGDINYDPEIEHLISIPQNYTLEDILQKLGQDALQINDVLTNVNKIMSLKLSSQDMEDVDLLEFFKEYIELKKIDINNKFLIEVSGSNFICQINKSSFKDLIDQLLVNADKHAFINQSKIAGNKVQFNIKNNKDRGIAIIEYQNNGRPFLLSNKDFITPFQKSQSSKGSGIGGNYIFRIIEAHKGNLLIKEGLKSGFNMSIELPLNQNTEK